MAEGNEFCTLDGESYPKWSVLNAARWKLTPNWGWFPGDSGREQLLGYKRAWISYNRKRIVEAATANRIPADFLGCVIFNEVGGDPPWVKHDVVLHVRQYVPWTKSPMVTSEGAIKIQLEVALSAMDYRGPVLSREQQSDLTSCLETDSFNISVVAKYLRKLILFDYPGSNTERLTDEQFVISGSRYNRGTARALKDFQASLKDKPGGADRVYTSYGRAMLRHRFEVRMILGRM